MRILILVACFWLATSLLHAKIVFHSDREGNNEIYKMKSDGSNQTQLTFNEASDTYPVWSPDGRQIAFQSNRDGNNEIYVMDADGTNQRNLTNHPASDSFADWSPDGSRIIFSSKRKVEGIRPINLFMMDSDGTDVEQLAHSGVVLKSKWSPDGTKIAFGNSNINIVNAEGRNTGRVSGRPKVDKAMCLEGWSPDGTQILYSEVDRPSDKDTLVIAMLNAVKRLAIRWRRVAVPSKLEMVYHSAAFSADGKAILFAGRQADTDDWDIYRFRLADRKLTQLTANLGDNFAPQESNPRLSVSPQGLIPTLWGEIKTTR